MRKTNGSASGSERTTKPFRSKDHPVPLDEAGLRATVHRLLREKSELKRERIIANAELRSLKEENTSLKKELEDLREESLLDGLTKVKNRKGFDLSLGQEVSRLPTSDDLRQSASHSLGLLFIDADFFKQVNDQYGHGVGDQVLVALARATSDSVRTYDKVCRLGGEEFVVIMPDTSQLGLEFAGEKVRRAVEELIFDEYVDLKVTVSIGGAVQTHQADHDLLERADKALYLAKENGRNQVVIAEL